MSSAATLTKWLIFARQRIIGSADMSTLIGTRFNVNKGEKEVKTQETETCSKMFDGEDDRDDCSGELAIFTAPGRVTA